MTCVPIYMVLGIVCLFAGSEAIAQITQTPEFSPGDSILFTFELSATSSHLEDYIPKSVFQKVRTDGTIEMPWDKARVVTGCNADELVKVLAKEVRRALWFADVEVKAMHLLTRKILKGRSSKGGKLLDRPTEVEMGDHWLPGEYEKELKQRFPDWYRD